MEPFVKEPAKASGRKIGLSSREGERLISRLAAGAMWDQKGKRATRKVPAETFGSSSLSLQTRLSKPRQAQKWEQQQPANSDSK